MHENKSRMFEIAINILFMHENKTEMFEIDINIYISHAWKQNWDGYNLCTLTINELGTNLHFNVHEM